MPGIEAGTFSMPSTCSATQLGLLWRQKGEETCTPQIAPLTQPKISSVPNSKIDLCKWALKFGLPWFDTHPQGCATVHSSSIASLLQSSIISLLSLLANTAKHGGWGKLMLQTNLLHWRKLLGRGFFPANSLEATDMSSRLSWPLLVLWLCSHILLQPRPGSILWISSRGHPLMKHHLSLLAFKARWVVLHNGTFSSNRNDFDRAKLHPLLAKWTR